MRAGWARARPKRHLARSGDRSSGRAPAAHPPSATRARQQGPTLEIFTYVETLERPHPVANRAGYGHVAFEVSDVTATLESVLEHGGEPLGTIAKTEVPGVGGLEVTYARDPEGNIIELQSWRHLNERDYMPPPRRSRLSRGG